LIIGTPSDCQFDLFEPKALASGVFVVAVNRQDPTLARLVQIRRLLIGIFTVAAKGI
jgi:hypothetical protein